MPRFKKFTSRTRKVLKEFLSFLKIAMVVIGTLTTSYYILHTLGYTLSIVDGCSSNSMPGSFNACLCPILYQRYIGSIQEGDILLYTSQGRNIIHRMTGYCYNEDHAWAYQLKGDSPFNGYECIPPYNIYGKLLYKFC